MSSRSSRCIMSSKSEIANVNAMDQIFPIVSPLPVAERRYTTAGIGNPPNSLVFFEMDMMGWIRVGFRSARRFECRLYRLEVFRSKGLTLRTNIIIEMVAFLARKQLFHSTENYIGIKHTN